MRLVGAALVPLHGHIRHIHGPKTEHKYPSLADAGRQNDVAL